MSSNRKLIWYWPGIYRKSTELNVLLGSLGESQFDVKWIDHQYDSGLPPDNPNSDIRQWVADPQEKPADWWIGLSLGAAVAHISLCCAPQSRLPKRLTLINPFADRVELAAYAGFSIADQWNLIPVGFRFKRDIAVELVVSSNDVSVPPEQGMRLLSCYPTSNVTVINLHADHSISSISAQRSLASILLSQS